MKEFINALIPALMGVLIVIIGYACRYVKVKVGLLCDTKTKKLIVETGVKAVEQLYKGLGGENKLEKAKDYIITMAHENGINFTDAELNVLIESVVSEFNVNRADEIVKPEVSE